MKYYFFHDYTVMMTAMIRLIKVDNEYILQALTQAKRIL